MEGDDEGGTMKATLMPLEGEDLLRGADRLRALVYPDHPEARDTAWHRAVRDWLASHPLAGDLHRWIVVAGDGEVVGHLAAVPQHYRILGRRVVAHTPFLGTSWPEPEVWAP